MQVQINTDHNIEGREKLAEFVKGVVETTLARHRTRLTRVEVHLSDENGSKNGQDDKRCMMEARMAGHQSTAVTHHAASIDQAVHGAVEKLQRSLESTIARIDDHR